MSQREKTDSSHAFQALWLLAQKSLDCAQPLPARVDVSVQWGGVGFSFLGRYFVVSMNDIHEMLEVPGFTKLPGVKSWVRGIANVRGRLMSIFDMAAYFGGHLGGARKQQRLLVIDRDRIYAGLWVDQVFGMQYFPANIRNAGPPESLPAILLPFTDGYFNREGLVWTVFRPLQLLEESQFMDVAIA